MCRIFGFRSVIQSQVHHSLVNAENAIATQSSNHPDGWGVAYYVTDAPHIIRSENAAINDSLFKRLSGIVSSQTVLAHIRKTTIGRNDILNTHPFQYGRWIFAHNGNIKNFQNHRERLYQEVSPKLRRFILGETDSELLFFIILTYLSSYIDLSQKNCPFNELSKACNEAIATVLEICGPYHEDNDAPSTETFLTFIITNGETMLAHQAGKKLYYSTYKNKCSESTTCPSYGQQCESPSQSGFINHLIFSSEPLSGENVWLEMKNGQMIGVDTRMKLFNVHC